MTVESEPGDQDQVDIGWFHQWARWCRCPYAVSASFEIGVQIVDLSGGHGFGVPVDGWDTDAFALGEGLGDE